MPGCCARRIGWSINWLNEANWLNEVWRDARGGGSFLVALEHRHPVVPPERPEHQAEADQADDPQRRRGKLGRDQQNIADHDDRADQGCDCVCHFVPSAVRWRIAMPCAWGYWLPDCIYHSAPPAGAPPLLQAAAIRPLAARRDCP